MNSIVKPIPGFEGRYSVTDGGIVISHLKRGHFNDQVAIDSRAVTPHKRPDGYCSVVLTKQLVRNRSYLIHRLVAEAFFGSIPKGMHVAHLNGDRSDNRLDNLKVCTPQENEAHKREHGTDRRGSAPLGEANKWAKLSEANVLAIRALGSSGQRQVDIARQFGVSQFAISSILRRRTWRHI